MFFHYSFKSIIDFCHSNNIFVLEDGAQSIGVFNEEGIHSSISGDIGVISFFADWVEGQPIHLVYLKTN